LKQKVKTVNNQQNQAFQALLLTLAEIAQQVVDLFCVPASADCCCSGAAKMPVLRQQHHALALKFFLQVP
jgi:hypothetical protein